MFIIHINYLDAGDSFHLSGELEKLYEDDVGMHLRLYFNRAQID